MDELIARMLQTVIGGEYARNTFPILTHWGLRDQDLMIHSLGVSYWTQLGHELGLIGVCEIPAPASSSVAFYGDDVRTDGTAAMESKPARPLFDPGLLERWLKDLTRSSPT